MYESKYVFAVKRVSGYNVLINSMLSDWQIWIKEQTIKCNR